MLTRSDDSYERQNKLERQVRTLTILCLVLSLGLIATIITIRATPVQAQTVTEILRARGLIIEDEDGRARIIIGAPVPQVGGRRRSDPASGIVVLSETGVDRVAIGYPAPSPQIEGSVHPRVAGQAGIVIDDADGNERGGFGVLDNGTVSLGLDYPGREAVSLAVVPGQGFAGLTVNAPQGSKSERAEIGVLSDGTSLLKLADTGGSERAMLMVQGETPAKLLGISPKVPAGFDVDVSWFVPGANQHIAVASGRTFMQDVAKLKP
jgi:hypothetical protein